MAGEVRSEISFPVVPRLDDKELESFLLRLNEILQDSLTGKAFAVPTEATTITNQGALATLDAVDTGQIVDTAVTEAKLADLAVTLQKIRDNAISSDKIVDTAVTEAKLADLAVTLAKLAANAVSSDKIVDLAVTEAKLDANAVTLAKVATNAVDSSKIVDLAVTEAKLAALSVSLGKLAADSVDKDKLTILGVDADGKLVLGQIGSGDLDDVSDGTTFKKLLAALQLSPSDNFVDNPDFEAGIEGWTGLDAGDIASISDGHFGAKVLQRIGVETGELSKYIPIDPSKTYYGEFWVRQTVNPTSGGSLVYVGINNYNYQKNTTSAGRSLSRSYFIASNEEILVADGWQLFTGYITGTGASENQFATDARYARPYFIINYSNGNGTAEVAYFRLTEVNPDNIPESSTRKWAAEPGADVTGDHTAANVTGQGALATLNTVNTAQIDNDAITAAKILAGEIGTAHLVALAVTAGKIAALAIETDKLAANAVTAAKIAAGTITATEIAALTITAGNIAANAITTAKINALAIDTGKLAANAVTAAKIAAGTITATEMAALSIETGALVAGSVTAAKIASLAIETDKLAANAVTAAKIAAGTITATEIASLTILADNIVANTITAGQIAALTIDAGVIKANAIITSKINNLAVTDAKIGNLEIKTAKINNLAVSTGKLADNAAHREGYATSGVSTNLSTSWVSKLNVSIDSVGNLISVVATCKLRHYGTNLDTVYWRLRQGASTIIDEGSFYSTNIDAVIFGIRLTGITVPGSGSITFHLDLMASAAGGVWRATDRNIFGIEHLGK